MAFTVSQITNTVFGNERVVVLNVTPDSAEGAVTVPGISRVVHATLTPKTQASFIASGNTSQTYPTYVENAGTTGTVIAGTVGLSGLVASNVYRLVVYGV